MGVDPMEVPVQAEGPGHQALGLGRGTPRPVGLPNPRLAIWASSRFSPSAWAISIVPMLEDWARMLLGVSRSVPCASASWKVYVPIGREDGTEMTWFGVITPAARAAEKVTSLNTEPGS